jgi:hypothetical protein
MKNLKMIAAMVLVVVGIVGCGTSKQQVLRMDESQIQMRSIQTRVFDTTDKEFTMRAVMATLQDLGFIISDANESLGTISATKLDGYQLKMTVSIRPRNEKQLLVRANAQYNITPIKDPVIYQDFFTALSKSMFLSANSVE